MTTLDDIAHTLEKIELRQDHFMREVETIKRGIYGDSVNNVAGLLETDRKQDGRIHNLEEAKKRAIWTGGGILVAIELLWQFVRSKFDL
jgi:hypothetical protein